MWSNIAQYNLLYIQLQQINVSCINTNTVLTDYYFLQCCNYKELQEIQKKLFMFERINIFRVLYNYNFWGSLHHPFWLTPILAYVLVQIESFHNNLYLKVKLTRVQYPKCAYRFSRH